MRKLTILVFLTAAVLGGRSVAAQSLSEFSDRLRQQQVGGGQSFSPSEFSDRLRAQQPAPPTRTSVPETMQMVKARKLRALQAAKAAEPAITSLARAKTMLVSARNLEKMGNAKGSAEFYRQVIKLAPGSAEAVEAAKRVKALAGVAVLPAPAVLRPR